MSCMITNICNKKTKGPTLMELFTATGKLEKFFFFLTTKDFFGLCRKLAQTRSTSSSAVNGWPLDFCLHKHKSFSKLFIPRTNGLVCRRVLCVLCTKCTVTTDLLVWYSNTQNDFCPGAAMCSQHTLASPSGRNVNYDEKHLTEKKNLFVPSICTGFVNSCPTVFL